jgi:AraC-like DNA-binding protein
VPVRGVRIAIKGRFLSDYLTRRFPQETFALPLRDRAKNACLRNPRLQVIFSQIRNSIRSGVECEMYYESKIIELLCVFSELNADCVVVPELRRLSGADRNAVEDVKMILEERFTDAPTIAQLALLTGKSQAKLQHDFKAIVGCTIHGYLQSIRMAKALDMVEHTETPLYIIAREVGCKKPGRFAELFKNTYGVTPDIHRRNLR